MTAVLILTPEERSILLKGGLAEPRYRPFPGGRNDRDDEEDDYEYKAEYDSGDGSGDESNDEPLDELLDEIYRAVAAASKFEEKGAPASADAPTPHLLSKD
jgi:hypothetical protein